jgi:sugar lactone lactonase YvrE
VKATAFSLVPGDILISNHGGNNVQRLDPVSGLVTTLTSVPGTPIGLAFDKTGNLYINVNTGIYKLNKATDALSPFFTGTGQREGLAFDPLTEHLFSVSFGANRIEEVDLSGALVRTISIPGTSSLLGVGIRSGRMVVADYGSGNLYDGTTTGSSFTSIGNVRASSTYAVDIDAAGNVFANDFSGNKTVKFTPGGGGFTKSDFITSLSTPANGLSIGDDGSFTISEFGANAISVWNSDATLRRRYSGVASPDELVVYAPVRESGGGGGSTVPDAGSLWPFECMLAAALLRAGRARAAERV